jgi:hypothetical protein
MASNNHTIPTLTYSLKYLPASHKIPLKAASAQLSTAHGNDPFPTLKVTFRWHEIRPIHARRVFSLLAILGNPAALCPTHSVPYTNGYMVTLCRVGRGFATRPLI